MLKKVGLIGLSMVIIVALGYIGFKYLKKGQDILDVSYKEIAGTVIQLQEDLVTIEDVNFLKHTFSISNTKCNIGDKVSIKYNDSNSEKYVLDCTIISVDEVYKNIPQSWKDNGIFSRYYSKAYETLNELTLDEKIGQILLVRFTDTDGVQEVKEYNFGGYVLYKKDFALKNKEQVISMIKKVQENSKIPLLTAVDEEGGTVVRISSNPNLAESKFKAASDIYNEGGLEAIKEDTLLKSKLLRELGINLNLAPVVDVATEPSDYMYNRTIQQDTLVTSKYAEAVIKASQNTGVSYTLKHFPRIW